jgi:prefoldin subunit 5
MDKLVNRRIEMFIEQEELIQAAIAKVNSSYKDLQKAITELNELKIKFSVRQLERDRPVLEEHF